MTTVRPLSSEKRKHAIISISPSSSSGEDEEEEESEEHDDDDDENYEDGEEESTSEDGSGSAEDAEEEGEAEEDEADDDSAVDAVKPEDQMLCNKVIDRLRRGKSVDTLKLEDCRAYLRKHGLRISGTKATCIERILHHWRLKDGNGEKLYPWSSFNINCTGDVCKGDVILFKQRVYEKFDIVTRGANIIGKRMIAGRVVKESYGAAKQQHTFTVEVLWSKGVKALSPLFPLLVKGRNLYRMKTSRQPWSNEAERSKVLAEKHRRGAAARHVRQIVKANSAKNDSKRKRDPLDKRAPPKKQRKKEPERAPRKQQNTCSGKASFKGHEKMKSVPMMRNIDPSVRPPVQASHWETGDHMRYPFSRWNPVDTHYNTRPELLWRSNAAPSQANREMIRGPGYGLGYPLNETGGLFVRGNYAGHHYLNPAYHLDPRSSSHQFRQQEFNNAHTISSEMQFHRWRRP